VVTRLAAALAALGIAAGAIIFWRSVVGSQGWSYVGYISEAGVSGSPHAFGYRFGIVLISGGLLLLGLALRHTLPVAACVAAMAVVAMNAPNGVLRTLSRAWLVAAAPLFLLAAGSLLLVGRSRLTGDTERLLLAVIIAWALVVAGLLTRAAKPSMSGSNPSPTSA
jgi:hypothetical protein